MTNNTDTSAVPEQEQIHLDYSLPNEQRSALVQKIIDSSPPESLSPRYLDKLAEYIVEPLEKKERKEGIILTANRKRGTIDKREISYEGLVSKFENGEDGIYNLIINDKNVIFTPKIAITAQDIETVPGLKELVKAIKQLEEKIKTATKGRKLLYQQLKEMRKDQYILRSMFKKPITFTKATNSICNIKIVEKVVFDKDGIPTVNNGNAISLLVPEHVSILLCIYDKLKCESYGKFQSDAYYLLLDLEHLIDTYIKINYPLYFDIIVSKIDKKTNEEIQKLINDKYGTKYSIEYLSSLWKKKIPTLIATMAQNEYLEWYFTFVKKGNWKKCSKCGEIKLAHNRFFSKNNTSKDGFYSVCKDCRNKKKGG